MLHWRMMLFEHKGRGLQRKSYHKSSSKPFRDNPYVKFG